MKLIRKNKTFILTFFTILCLIFFINASKQAFSKDEIFIDDIEEVNLKNEEEEIIQEIFENNKISKSVEETTVLDVIKTEDVSPEFRKRISDLLNQSQYEIDRYRTLVANYYKEMQFKLVELNKEVNNIQNFKDEMEANLGIAKWMIISLSIGIICLTSIVIIMWKSVVNVNRNDVEVIFATEKVRREIRNLEKRIEMLESVYKKHGK